MLIPDSNSFSERLQRALQTSGFGLSLEAFLELEARWKREAFLELEARRKREAFLARALGNHVRRMAILGMSMWEVDLTVVLLPEWISVIELFESAVSIRLTETYRQPNCYCQNQLLVLLLCQNARPPPKTSPST